MCLRHSHGLVQKMEGTIPYIRRRARYLTLIRIGAKKNDTRVMTSEELQEVKRLHMSPEGPTYVITSMRTLQHPKACRTNTWRRGLRFCPESFCFKDKQSMFLDCPLNKELFNKFWRIVNDINTDLKLGVKKGLDVLNIKLLHMRSQTAARERIKNGSNEAMPPPLELRSLMHYIVQEENNPVGQKWG